MGNNSYGAGRNNGIEEGYDMAKKDFKEETGIDFDTVLKVGKMCYNIYKKIKIK